MSEKKMDYFDFLENYRGMEFRCNGRVISKAAAYVLYMKNKLGSSDSLVTWRDKPGWCSGVLKNLKNYEAYLLKQKF